jgi:hypothetical protein
MENLIELHKWIMNEQNFLQIPNTSKWLSIVPEYRYKTVDANGYIITSRTPTGTKLNCALQVGDDYVDYPEFYTEEEFLDYLINQQ